MARTRAQRRRHNAWLTIALVATVLVVIFARDVSQSAHRASGPRSSENLTFAAAANAIVSNENLFDKRLDALITGGTHLSRAIFDARLIQLNDELPGWLIEAHQWRVPTLAHRVNQTFWDVTLERVTADESLLHEIASALSLPFTPTVNVAVDSSPTTTLRTSTATWNRARFSLVREPGHARLDASSNLAGDHVAASGLGALTSSRSLAVTRSLTISAVAVRPDALPAPAGVMLEPPVSSLHLGVTVTNGAFVTQGVTLTVTLTPTSAGSPSFHQILRTTLAPRQSYAFVPRPIGTRASERATLTIVAVGTPGGAALSTTRTYQVKMSPSGNG